MIIAASANGLVEQIGSYAGYASVIGLGVLALLYFSQAREVKRLREWAGRAPERAAELEERVQADAQKRVVAQPIAPASAAGVQAADARTQAATAAVYASIGATPPGAAPAAPGTPPAPGQLARAPGAVPAAPAPSPAAPGAVPSAPAPAPAASGATQTQTPAPTPTPTGRPIVTATPAPLPSATPAPLPSATPAPLPSATPPPLPSATPAAAAAARVAAASRTIPANGSTGQDTAESAAARPEPLPASAPPPPSRFDDDDDGGGFTPARIGMIVGGGLLAVIIGVVLMVTLTGDDADAPPENNFGNTPSVEDPPSGANSPDRGSGAGAGAGSSSAALTSAERRATELAVLNGTTQTGLARAVANKIQEDGFTIASVATNADQSVPTTIVSYSGDNEPAALAVAKIIGIDRGSVQEADANTTAAATADVIVIVGSDQIE